jgi:CHAD domain-containing protein
MADGAQRLSTDIAAPVRVTAERAFRLRAKEPVSEGIRRIALGQLDEVLDRLEGRTTEDPGTAVHEARKSLKRLRAIARFVRDQLGEEEFRRENACLRDVGRALSGPRDSQVLAETLDALLERYGEEAGAVRPERFGARLAVAQRAARRELDLGAPAFAERVTALREARGRVEAWRLPRMGAGAVRRRLERTYRRGRRAHAAAVGRPTPEALHEWRKRTKDLWYASQMLEAAAPGPLRASARRAHELSDLLGDDHDLVVLEQELDRHAEDFADPESGPLLRGLCERRRAELQVRAFAVGGDLYAASPARFARRIERGRRRRAR